MHRVPSFFGITKYPAAIMTAKTINDERRKVMNDLIYVSATTMAKAIKAKEVSSEEAVNAHLERIDEINPKLNAVVQLAVDNAREQAREADTSLARGEIKGPLHGVPITIKDNIETAGIISTSGTKGRTEFVPVEDATVVKRMKGAGAIILGKTNLPEVGLAFESDNLVYGRTNNPYDLERTPGGSSGGEAAIIAAGGSPLGLGNDAGGSIRLPSHFSGIAGIKPNTGRFPRTGHFFPPGGIIDTLWQVGPMARFVEDLILTMPVLYGVDWRDPGVIPMPLGDPKDVDLKGLKVSFHSDNGIVTPTPETIETVKAAAKSLSDEGIAVEEVRPPGIEQTYDLFMGLFVADGGAGVKMMLDMVGTTEYHPLMEVLLELQKEREMSSAEAGGLVFQWDMFRSTMLSFLENYDVVICPVNATPAMPHGVTFDEDRLPAFSYTMSYNLTGWPGAVVRGGTSPEGLPIGVQIVARPWREDVALAVAQHLETTLGGWQRPSI
jgi:amidase